MSNAEQSYRVELRFDVRATASGLDAEIAKATAALCEAGFSPDVTEVWDENWNEV